MARLCAGRGCWIGGDGSRDAHQERDAHESRWDYGDGGIGRWDRRLRRGFLGADCRISAVTIALDNNRDDPAIPTTR